MAENTFLGLQPYTEDDAYRFKGRLEESQELFRLIVRNDFTVCYAESGEGKTSLLNAGVFPLLRENMYFPIAITFTSDDYQVTPDNFSTIIDRCIKDSIAEYNDKNKGINVEYRLCSTDFQGLDCQAELQQELSKYSWWKLRNYKPQAMGLTFTPVFVFDQFEEVFNMPGSIVWTKKFFDWLEDVSSDSCPDEIVKKIRAIIGTIAAFPAIKEEKDFKAVFSLRKEFIGELDYWGMQKCFIPSLKDNRYCLKALTYEGAKKVMTQQKRFDESRVEKVLTYFVEQYSREPEKTIEENLPVIPALLLSVVGDSWEKDMDTFSTLSVDEVGQSLNMVLERFYNQAINDIVADLSQQNSSAKSEQCRYNLETALFALVDSNGKRVRTKTTTSGLTQVDFDRQYKRSLSDHRIIKVAKIEGEDYVEIVHDALCPIINKKKEERLVAEAKEKMRKQTWKWLGIIITVASVIILMVGGVAIHKNHLLNLVSVANEGMQTNLSRVLAEKANQLTEDHDSYLARLIALQALPPNLPYTIEAELALRNACQHDEGILRGHTGYVYSASFSLDGKYIVSASYDKTIRIWDAKTGMQVGEPLEGHTSYVYSASFSPDGKYIVSASWDGTVRIWNTKTGMQVGKPLKGHTSDIYSASFSPNGKYIVSASNDKTVRIWEAKTGRQVGEPLEGHTHFVSYASFSPDGKYIVSASGDKTVRIWDTKTGRQVGEPLKGHTDHVYSASFSPDGKYIVSASGDKTIRIWNVKTGMQVGKPLEGHTDHVYSASFSPNGKYIVSASWDKTVRIWDVKTGMQVGNPLEGHIGDVYSASFSPDGNSIVSASGDKTVRIWDIKTEKHVGKPLKGHTADIYSASFSPNGKYIVSASEDKTVRIWNTRTGEQVGEPLEGHTGYVYSASFSPDGRSIVSASGDKTVRIWDTKTGKQVGKPLEGHTASFSPDGRSIVSASEDNTIRIWDAKTGEQVGIPLKGYIGYVYSASFCPDGKYIVSALGDSTVRIWDTKTGKQVGKPLKGHTHIVHSASFSSDGKYIVSASWDETVRIWDVKTGEQVGEPLEGHTGYVTSASFSPDGKYIVSASYDKTVRIWNTKTGKQAGEPLRGHTGPVESVSFSPDGNSIVSASSDKTVRIWDFPTLDQLIQETTERFKNRQLTPKERRQYYLE